MSKFAIKNTQVVLENGIIWDGVLLLKIIKYLVLEIKIPWIFRSMQKL